MVTFHLNYFPTRFLQLSGDGSPASGVPGTTPFIHRDTNFFLLQG